PTLGAFPACDLDVSTNTQFLVFESFRPLPMLLQYLVGADEHSLPLIIKVGAIADVLEVGIEETHSTAAVIAPQLVDFLHGSDRRAAFGTWSRRRRRFDYRAGGVDELRHFP